jgi:hypothetical protein
MRKVTVNERPIIWDQIICDVSGKPAASMFRTYKSQTCSHLVATPVSWSLGLHRHIGNCYLSIPVTTKGRENVNIALKVKFTLEQAMKTEVKYRYSSTPPLHLGARWRWVVHTPAAVPSGMTRYPWCRVPRAGLERCGKSCPPPRIRYQHQIF